MLEGCFEGLPQVLCRFRIPAVEKCCTRCCREVRYVVEFLPGARFPIYWMLLRCSLDKGIILCYMSTYPIIADWCVSKAPRLLLVKKGFLVRFIRFLLTVAVQAKRSLLFLNDQFMFYTASY